MKYNKKKMNEMDLINNFSKDQLINLLKIQIDHENYEGAKVVKSAIDQYDEIVDDGEDYLFGWDEEEDESDEEINI